LSKEGTNLLAAVRLEKPEYIPMDFHISGACCNHYPQDALLELIACYPVLFPDFDGSVDKVVPACPLWEQVIKKICLKIVMRPLTIINQKKPSI
jgi:hypothetical protein